MGATDKDGFWSLSKPYLLPLGILAFERGLDLIAPESDWLGGALVGFALTILMVVLLSDRRIVRRFPKLQSWFPFMGIASQRFANPEEVLGPYVRNRHIRIADIAHRNRLTGITFDECDIYGPAVLMFLHPPNIIQGCSFVYRDASFVEIPQGAKEIDGVIGITDCHFKRCHFFGVAFMGPPDWVRDARANLTESTSRIQASPSPPAP